MQFKSHYPARGRKLDSRRRAGDLLKFKSHYPARGRKHLGPSLRVRSISRFKSHYPARGRKREELSLCSKILAVQIPLPRKGTETSTKSGEPSKTNGSNPITPQGDGNKPGPDRLGMREVLVFKSHYPARGRKPTYPSFGPSIHFRSNPITPQGDGNS